MAPGPPSQPSSDPLDWTPMRPSRSRRQAAVHDPIIEPLWSGLRVLVHVKPAGLADASSSVRIMEAGGADLTPELPDLAADLGRCAGGAEAVIDGIITSQVALEGLGAAVIPEVHASHSRLLLGGTAELDIRPRGRPSGPGATRDVEHGMVLEGCMAVDLLRLDGIVLLDVPLLERKRLLESALSQSDLVRLSVHTRPPFEAWVATWKALGLRGGILKAANSRYEPGARTPEWRCVETVGRQAP